MMIAWMLALVLQAPTVKADPPKPTWRISREIQPGDGRVIMEGDVVTFEFIARVPSGKEIANTYRRGLSFTLKADRKGGPLAGALVGMRETGEREVSATFGASGIPGVVPLDEPILIDIKIDSVKPVELGQVPTKG